MYKDKNLDTKGYINEVHAMTYDEAVAITGNGNATTGLRKTEAYYWLANTYYSGNSVYVRTVRPDGVIEGNSGNYSFGIRPVVSLTSGVYVKSGTGTEADPYILGKD